MKLYIIVEHPNLIVQLKDQDKVVDEQLWQDQNDMSQTLLANIDELLERNKLTITELETVEVETEQASFTSARIAKTVAKTLQYCLDKENQR